MDTTQAETQAPSEREAALFLAAIGLGRGGERQTFLEQACAGDLLLLERLKDLLAAHDRSHSIVDTPAPEAKNTIKIVPPNEPANELIGEKLGHYRLREKIGEGATGIVYLADQLEPLRREVAIKVIKAGVDRGVVARFQAERQTLARMNHPNVAKVFDGGATESGRPYFVMELVRGEPITEYCDKQALSVDKRLRLLVNVCQAIQHAHQHGIIHRDIKPSNVLVMLQDGESQPKVIDFGIAKATQGPLTDAPAFTGWGQLIGTPKYMSPEQAAMGPHGVDTRTDVYSLGVLLYELLVGKTPFDAKQLKAANPLELGRILRETDPLKPSAYLRTIDSDAVARVAQCRGFRISTSLRGDRGFPAFTHSGISKLVPYDLDWIAMKALEKDPARRYDTAADLGKDITSYLEHEPVSAHPPNIRYKLKKFTRRHQIAVAVTAVLLCCLCLGFLVSTWLFYQERSARSRAIAAEQRQAELRKEADNARENEQKHRERAESGEHNAKVAAIKSDQVAQMIREMLSSVSPSVALGRDTTLMREILDKTADRLSYLRDQPDVQAELRSIIGGTYLRIGHYGKAEAQIRIALGLRMSLYGETNESVAASLTDLARVLLNQGSEQKSLFDAETAIRKALAIHKILLGDEHPELALSLYLLASTLQRQGKFLDAQAKHSEALVMRRRIFGDQHPDVADSLNNLALVLVSLGKPAEAEVAVQEAMAIQESLIGKDHPDVADTLTILARVFHQQGRLQDSEKIHRRVLEMYLRMLGREHPNMLTALDNLASDLKNKGDWSGSEIMRREALALRRKLLGNEHVDVAWTLSELGIALEKLGDLKGAEGAYREALAIRRTLFGNVHDEVAWSLSGLGRVLYDRGEIIAAEGVEREALRIRRSLLGQTNEWVAMSLNRIVRLLQAQRKFEDAEAVARECWAIRMQLMSNDWTTFNIQSHVGASLVGQKKYTEAEPLLLAGYEGMKERQDRIPHEYKSFVIEACQRLVYLYDAWEKSSKATEWRQKLASSENVPKVGGVDDY